MGLFWLLPKVLKTGFTVEFGQNTMFTAGFTNLPKTQTEYGNGSHGKYEFWDGADGGSMTEI